MSLNGQWRFKGFEESNGEEQGAFKPEYNDEGWVAAEVPGTVHTDLMANKLLADPFKDQNENKVQWVPETEWWYRKEIVLPPEVLGKQVVELDFDGLDTFATVWVNGKKVGEANNMFTPWRFSIKEAVKTGKNTLAIRFKPIYRVARELEAKYRGKYGNLHAENFSARPYVRKVQYSFGWDWGPTLPTAGIWRPCRILAFDGARLGYFSALPTQVDKARAKVKLVAEVYAATAVQLRLKFTLSGFNQNVEREVTVEAKAGLNFVDCVVDVAEPRLWWPRGYGEPALYDASVALYVGSEFLGEVSVKVGIRSVELLQEPDEEGTSFIFAINGQSVFCRGANWIPADSFLPRVTADHYRRLLDLAAKANFNMLRVWGGGVYEDAVFYGLCDELGIMVWQDFMYACAAYPEEEWFLKMAEAEAAAVVRRLRGHPCIVVWCGNNEIQWHHKTIWKDRAQPFGYSAFDEILPSVLRRLDGTRPYRPSTPYHGEEDPNSQRSGTRHNWVVWSKQADYPAYLEDTGRFLTEFGWQAPPSLELLRQYLESADLNVDSAAFLAHEKQVNGLKLLRTLLALHYPVPEDFERFVLYAQLNQAEALKTAVTHWRSRMFKTSGCLIWQLNDCWPAVSWSLVDYGLKAKPAYFFVKRALEPVISPLMVKGGRVHGYVVNETRESLELAFGFEVFRFTGESLHSESRMVHVPAYSSLHVLDVALDELPVADDCILTASILKNDAVLCGDVKTVGEPKDLKLPSPQIHVKAEKIGAKTFQVTLEAPVYVKAVILGSACLAAKFSDNYFDLIPSRQKTVSCQLEEDMSLSCFEEALSWQAYPYT